MRRHIATLQTDSPGEQHLDKTDKVEKIKKWRRQFPQSDAPVYASNVDTLLKRMEELEGEIQLITAPEEATGADLAQERKDKNSWLVAYQDKVRKLDTDLAKLREVVILTIESQGWDGNDPNDNRWREFYSKAKKVLDEIKE